MKNKILAIAAILAISGFNLGLATSAQAATIRLDVPKPVMDLWKKIQTEKVGAQESNSISSQPTAQVNPQPTNIQPIVTEPTINHEPPKENFIPPSAPTPKPPMDNFSDQKSPEKNNLPPPNQQPPKGDFNQQPFQGENKPFNNQNSNKGPEMQNGKDDERAMRDFKRGAKQMEDMVKRFEKQMTQAEKSGGAISEDMKSKISQAKQLLEKIKGANTTDDMGDNTMEQLQEIMDDLQQNGHEVLEKIQRLAGIKKEIRHMERGVSMFEKQITKLTKQKITVPQEIADNMAKLKTIVTGVKNAKTWDEVENAGLEDMGDLMQSLGESQQNLEMLARWPQTLKQMDKELKNLERQVKKSKSTVEKLTNKGIDLTENFANFSSEVDKLKSIREEANNKMQSGDSLSAFDLVENEFFYKMDEVYENQRIIDTMANLGRFNSDFKNGLNSLKKEMANLKKKGEDVSEVQSLYDEVKQKGDEILTLMKARPIDADAIISALEDMEGIRQQGTDKIQELGGGESMPWEQGQRQFEELRMSPNMNKFIPQKQAPQSSPNPIGEPNPSTAP